MSNTQMNLIDDAEYIEEKPRSPHWPAVKAAHLKLFPRCLVCDGDKALNVHHIQPYHLYPERELDPTNLATLCENKGYGCNCHLLFGHLGNFSSFNVNVIEDAKTWNGKLKNRPKGDRPEK